MNSNQNMGLNLLFSLRQEIDLKNAILKRDIAYDVKQKMSLIQISKR